jgi:hypothetical protein
VQNHGFEQLSGRATSQTLSTSHPQALPLGRSEPLASNPSCMHVLCTRFELCEHGGWEYPSIYFHVYVTAVELSAMQRAGSGSTGCQVMAFSDAVRTCVALLATKHMVLGGELLAQYGGSSPSFGPDGWDDVHVGVH